MTTLTEMPTYEAYKDSGVEWVGNIPCHWSAIRFRNIFSFSKGLNITKENLQDEGIPCVNYGEVHSKFGFEVNPEQHDLKCVDENYLKTNPNSLLKKGDFVFADTSEDLHGSGNFTQLISDVITFAGYHTVIVRLASNQNDKFLAYLFDSVSYRNQIRSKVKGVKVFSITKSILKNTWVWLPEQAEQTAIANFLDEKTAKIDEAIAIKEKQIELLKERKKIIIQQAVTQGLDPTVPMKDSGVEWIGQIPAHWEIMVMKHVINDVGDVDHYMPQSIDMGIPYLMTGDLKEFVSNINFENCKQVSYRDYLRLSKKINPTKGDVILARYATIGTAAYVDIDNEFLVSYSCVTIKPNAEKMLGLYLFQYFKSQSFLQEINDKVNTNTQGNVGISDLRKVKIPLPTIKEQLEIIEFIKDKINKADGLIALQSYQIEKLKEYKTTLINSAVTGKIKVV